MKALPAPSFNSTMVWKYLDRTYRVKEGEFYLGESIQFGQFIVSTLSLIFSIDKNRCDELLKHWAYSKNMTGKEYEKAFSIHFTNAQMTALIDEDIAGVGRLVMGVDVGLDRTDAMMTALYAEMVGYTGIPARYFNNER